MSLNKNPAIVEETDQDIMDWLDDQASEDDGDENESLDWLNGDGTDETEESPDSLNFAALLDSRWGDDSIAA